MFSFSRLVGRGFKPPSNLATNSEARNLWTASGASVTSNVTTQPTHGGTTVDQMTESGGLSGHSLTIATTISFTSGTTYTYSEIVKYDAGTAQFVQLLLGSAAFGSNAWGNFDIQNGTVQTKGSAATTSIIDLGSGWYRCVLTATATGTASTAVALYAANSGTMTRAASYTGSTANRRLLGGAQVETGSSAGTYVPT